MQPSHDIIICGAEYNRRIGSFSFVKFRLFALVLSHQKINHDYGRAVAHVESGDQITRLADAYGEEIAKDIWAFNKVAFDQLKSTMCKLSMDYTSYKSIRLACEPFEVRELDMATQLIQDILPSVSFSGGSGAFTGYKVQKIEDAVMSFDSAALIRLLLEGVECVGASVAAVSEESDGVLVDCGETLLRSELFIGAAHLSMQEMLPLPGGKLGGLC